MNKVFDFNGLTNKFAFQGNKIKKSFEESSAQKTVAIGMASAGLGFALSKTTDTFTKSLRNAGRCSIFTVGTLAIASAITKRLSKNYPEKSNDEKGFVKTVFEMSSVGLLGLVDASLDKNFKPVTDVFNKFAKLDKMKILEKFGKTRIARLIQSGGDLAARRIKVPAMVVGTTLIASSLAYLAKKERQKEEPKKIEVQNTNIFVVNNPEQTPVIIKPESVSNPIELSGKPAIPIIVQVPVIPEAIQEPEKQISDTAIQMAANQVIKNENSAAISAQNQSIEASKTVNAPDLKPATSTANSKMVK